MRFRGKAVGVRREEGRKYAIRGKSLDAGESGAGHSPSPHLRCRGTHSNRNQALHGP